MDKNNLTEKESEEMKDVFYLNGRCMTLKIKRIQRNLIEETRAEESQAQNVFQNPLILHHVLSYLNNLKDLKNCRLVHSTWIPEASNVLKKKSIIKISKEFLKTSKKDMISLELFQPQNLLLFPTLDRNDPDYSNKDWGIVKEQFKKLSDGVKSLKFPTTEVTLPGGPQSFTEILNFNFLNLVQLVLGDSDFSWPNPPPPPIPSLKRIDWILNSKPSENLRPAKLILLEGVLKLAPNLETLKQAEESFIHRHLPQRFLEPQGLNIVLEHFIGNPSSCPNLKALYLDDLSPLDIDALSNLKIQLRSLKLSHLPRTEGGQNLQAVLKRQSGTLERLQLALPVYWWCQTTHFTFPCLPKLKKLKIVHKEDASDVKIDKVDFAKQFPALQKLVIKCIRKGEVSGIKERIWLKCPFYGAFLPIFGEDLDRQVCETLWVLKLPYPNHSELKLEDNDLVGIRARLSIMFPNVQNQFQKDYSSQNWGILKNQTTILSNAVKCLKFPYTKQDREECEDDDFFEPATKSFAEVLHYNLPNLVHLDLRDSDFSWSDPPPPPIHSLKRVDWIMNCKPRPADRPATLTLLEGVFKFAPNLETLNLRKEEDPFPRGEHWYRFLGGYRGMIRRGPRPPGLGLNIFLDHFNRNPSSCANVKDLTLHDLSAVDFEALSNLTIQLRSLKLSSLPVRADYQKLHDFLKSQNGTLERLRLAFPTAVPLKAVPHFTFPCLPNLTNLTFYHNSDSFRMTFEDIDYAKMFPALHTLEIYGGCGGTNDKDWIWLICPAYSAFLPLYAEDLNKQVCRTLRELHLPYPSQPELKSKDNELFGIRERLSIMFPNVHNEHLDIGRTRVAEGHPYLPIEPVPVCRCTRSKKPALAKNGIGKKL